MIKVDKQCIDVEGSGVALLTEWSLVTTSILEFGLREGKLPRIREIMKDAFEFAISDEAVEMMREDAVKDNGSTM